MAQVHNRTGEGCILAPNKGRLLWDTERVFGIGYGVRSNGIENPCLLDSSTCPAEHVEQQVAQVHNRTGEGCILAPNRAKPLIHALKEE